MTARVALALALTVAACGGARPTTTATTTGADTTVVERGIEVHRDGACRTWGETADRERAIDDRNQAALARALAEANLTEVDYRADWLELPYGGDADAGGWQVIEAEGARTLLSPQTERGCGARPWPLAVDGSGHLFALMIQQREVAHHELSVCGCDAQVPATCGGAAPETIRWRWSLPAEVTFDGPFSVVTEVETYLPSFTGRPDGKPCPMRMAPP